EHSSAASRTIFASSVFIEYGYGLHLGSRVGCNGPGVRATLVRFFGLPPCPGKRKGPNESGDRDWGSGRTVRLAEATARNTGERNSRDAIRGASEAMEHCLLELASMIHEGCGEQRKDLHETTPKGRFVRRVGADRRSTGAASSTSTRGALASGMPDACGARNAHPDFRMAVMNSRRRFLAGGLAVCLSHELRESAAANRDANARAADSADSHAAARSADPHAAARSAMLAEIERDFAATAASTGMTSLDPAVREALERVPRHRFVPAEQARLAYQNRPLPIGHEQTISQPFIVALMTQLIEPRPEHRVLEIGTGSGYQAAVLAEIVARVHTIEIVRALGERAAALLQTLGYDNVDVRIGDGYHGWPEAAPFDAIVLTAA